MSSPRRALRALSLCMLLAACDHLPGCEDDADIGNLGNCATICAQLNACGLLPSPLGEGVADCTRRCRRSSQPEDAARGDGGVYADVDQCVAQANGNPAAGLCSQSCETLASCLNHDVGAARDLSGVGSLEVQVQLLRDAVDGGASDGGHNPQLSACNPLPDDVEDCAGGDAGLSCVVDAICPTHDEQFYLELNAQGRSLRSGPLSCADFFFESKNVRRRYTFVNLPAGLVTLTIRSVRAVPVAPTPFDDMDAGPTDAAVDMTMPSERSAFTAGCAVLAGGFSASVPANRLRSIRLVIYGSQLNAAAGATQACGFDWIPAQRSFDAGMTVMQ